MIYCYESPSGVILERVFPVGKAPRSVIDKCGQLCLRSFQAESISVPAPAGWPMTCYASGVHPEQAGELRKTLADSGVPTEVTRAGDPIYRDARHRRAALKVRGIVDKSSFI